MAGFFDRLLGGFTEVATNLYRELETSSEQSVIDQCILQELSSTAKLAQADILLLADAEQRNGQLSDEQHNGATASVSTLRDDLAAKAGYLAGLNRQTRPTTNSSLTFNSTVIRRAATDLAQLSDSIKVQPPKLTAADTTELLQAAGEILDSKIKECLSVVYAALTKQMSSNCNHQHVARLKMTGFTGDIDHQMQYFFDLFLSSPFDMIPQRWVQTRCTVERSLSTVDPLGCHLIQESETLKQSLSLRLGEEPAGSLLRGRGVLLSNPPIPKVSLGHLIENGYFDKTFRNGIIDPQDRYFLPSERAALCCTLARSLLHLTHGHWTRVDWGIDGIFFLEDASTGRLLDKSKPYLSWAIERNTSERTSSALNGTVVDTEASRNLTLINFARLLIEVYGHQRIWYDQEAEDLHSALFGCMDEISDHNVRLAVMACLGSEGIEAVQDESNPDRLQTFINQKVLQRLESNKASYGKPQLGELRTAPQAAAAAALPNRRSTLSDKSPYDGTECDSPEDPFAAKEALKFVSQMKKYTDCYIKRPENCRSPVLSKYLKQKIRIAIIDSGVRKADTFIMGAKRGGRIRECFNFLPGPPDQWDDTHGHGTHIARILLDMAPEAEIYVAKVTNGQRIEPDMVSCITSAVNWAVQVWQVDIISLSLVMPEKNENLGEALNQAMDPEYDCGRRRIVFAAAGNTGGTAPMGWLATMPNIIAIHATDGLGAAANFNPTSISGISFATLGRDIQSKWKESGTRNSPKPVYLSGTSFATPIAVAIAANVLEWARWNIKLTEDRKKLLYSPGKMRLIFQKMMQARSGVHYVQPWTLWDHGWDDGTGMKKKVADVLADVIAS